MTDMSGRTVVLTGATLGIGRATAVALARMDADLVLVARDRARGEALVAELSEIGKGKRELLLADLSSMASVRDLAAEIKARHSRIDVLINNAGGLFLERELTVDGLERTYALNHLAYFVLTLSLLDLLRAGAPSRVVNVSSVAHKWGPALDFDNLQGEKSFTGWNAYSHSKLENLLFTFELARRVQGTGITVNAAHPGPVASGFGHNNRGWRGMLFKLGAPFMISPERGAQTTIYLATSPEVAGVTGKYFPRQREAKPSAAALDASAAGKLWEVSEPWVKPTGSQAAHPALSEAAASSRGAPASARPS